MQIQKYAWGEIFVSQDLVCHICWKHFPRDHHWGQEMEVLIYLYSLAHGAPHYLELAWRYRPGYTLMDALLGSNSSWNQHHRDYINYKLVSIQAICDANDSPWQLYWISRLRTWCPSFCTTVPSTGTVSTSWLFPSWRWRLSLPGKKCIVILTP